MDISDEILQGQTIFDYLNSSASDIGGPMLSVNRRNFRIISPCNGRGEPRQLVAFSLPHKTSLDPRTRDGQVSARVSTFAHRIKALTP